MSAQTTAEVVTTYTDEYLTEGEATGMRGLVAQARILRTVPLAGRNLVVASSYRMQNATGTIWSACLASSANAYANGQLTDETHNETRTA